MRIGQGKRVRRVAQWGAGLLLILVGSLTIVLFLHTGTSVPRAFTPAGQLSFRVNESDGTGPGRGKPLFVGFSPSGRCIFAVTPNTNDFDDLGFLADVEVTVIDPGTMQKLGSIKRDRNGLRLMEISPDGQYLVWATSSRLHFWHLESGKKNSIPIVTPWGDLGETDNLFGASAVFAPGGDRLLLHATNRAVCFDMSERRMIAAFQAPELSQILACFFDSRTRAKILVGPGKYEVWDLATNQMELEIDESETSILKQSNKDLESTWWLTATGAPILANAYIDPNLLLTRSLEDGRRLQSFALPAAAEYPEFSSDGRYLIYHYFQNDPLVRLVIDWHRGFAWRLKERFPDKYRLALVDLQTGMQWVDLVGDASNWSIAHNGARLITFTDEGRYEYDIPPRWQYFTPWAWGALGAWLGLAALWWRLRKRQRGATPVG